LLGSILGLLTAAAARLSERVRNDFGWHARERELLPAGCSVSEEDEKDNDEEVVALLLVAAKAADAVERVTIGLTDVSFTVSRFMLTR